MQLSISTNTAEAVLVCLSGPVTQTHLLSTADPLQELLGPDVYRRRVSLDLSGASYLDSSGVSWLLACQKRMRQAGGRLTLIKPHPVVANLLRVLKLEKMFEADGL